MTDEEKTVIRATAKLTGVIRIGCTVVDPCGRRGEVIDQDALGRWRVRWGDNWPFPIVSSVDAVKPV